MLNLKDRKEVAREILRDASKKEESIKFKASLIGMEFNEKGNFYTLLMEVEATHKHSKGEMALVKNIPLPVSLTQDIIIKEPEERPKKKKAVTHKQIKDMAKKAS